MSDNQWGLLAVLGCIAILFLSGLAIRYRNGRIGQEYVPPARRAVVYNIEVKVVAIIVQHESPRQSVQTPGLSRRLALIRKLGFYQTGAPTLGRKIDVWG